MLGLPGLVAGRGLMYVGTDRADNEVAGVGGIERVIIIVLLGHQYPLFVFFATTDVCREMYGYILHMFLTFRFPKWTHLAGWKVKGGR